MTKKFTQSLKSKDIKELLQKLVFIIIGNFLCSIAFNVFFIPNKLLSGGVGGLAIIIQYLTALPAGISVFLINIPIFVIGSKMIDREFAIYGFISMLVLSFLLTITNGIGKYFIIDDILLASVFGGVFNGIGMGLMFRNRVSQGGFDIIAAILRKKYNINIGSGLMAVNTVIISLSSLLFGYKSAMYTLMAMYIGYKILDKVQTGFNVKKNIIIVSEKSEELAQAIITKLHRGVTFLEGIGGYTNEDKKVIYCIVTSRETATLKNIVEEIDPSAFFTINDVVEVKGSGFKNVGI
ncbi:YitT family protein [Clostridium sp. Cult1]|uniref:YitT family protein n=1 Tax=Clostridium sp. Cult1 TaxID=2079002 RepID=UPI001F229BDF|nr:YitT family protein [Clostridium sp. Cult1]MCF6462956.1 YitT family protein [Clostridium sp. Cult1]